MKVNCDFCGISIDRCKSHIGKNVFCSRKHSGERRLGEKFSEKTRGKMSLAAIERFKVKENHARWKGDKVGYTGLHNWIRKELGHPEECSSCSIRGRYIFAKNGVKRWSIQLANKSKEYKERITRYYYVCDICDKEVIQDGRDICFIYNNKEGIKQQEPYMSFHETCIVKNFLNNTP